MPSSNPIVQKVMKAQEETLKVSFLVGNGFDIGLGLKTKYTDFINRYVSKKVSVGPTIDELKAKIEKRDLDWGDAEYAFGQLDFDELGEDVESAYRESLHDFQMSLEEYLAEESSRFVVDEIKTHELRDALLKSIVDIVATPNDKTILRDKKVIQLSVVNFNYTDTVDRILGGKGSPVGYNIGGGQLAVEVSNIVHPHGSLGQDILFGVDNPDQIANPDLKYLSKSEGYLVKSARAKLGECGFYDEAKNIIDSSEVLVLFGLSYGKTDSIWWNHIFSNAKRAYENSKRYDVILCPYTVAPIDAYTIDDRRYIKRQEKERFFANISVDRLQYLNMYPDLLNRIHVTGYGPYKDLVTGQAYYCDPLHLHSIGLRYVSGYDGKPIIKAKYP